MKIFKGSKTIAGKVVKVKPVGHCALVNGMMVLNFTGKKKIKFHMEPSGGDDFLVYSHKKRVVGMPRSLSGVNRGLIQLKLDFWSNDLFLNDRYVA